MRFLISLLLLTPFVITLSCTSTSRLDEMDDHFATWILAYNRAEQLQSKNADPAQACELYLNLAQEKEFVLHDLALIRAHVVCTDSQTLPAMPDKMVSANPWLEPVDLQRRLFEANNKKDFDELASATFRQAQLSDRQREKVDLLKSALEFAQKSKNKKMQDELQAKLYQVSPSLNPDPSPSDYPRVASDLIYLRQFDKGRQVLMKIINGKNFSAEDKYSARRSFRNSYKTEQRKAEYVRECKSFARWLEKQGNIPRLEEAYLTLARAQWTEGMVREAKRTLKAAETKLGGYGQDEIEWVWGRINEESHDLEKAIKHYDRGLQVSKAKSQWHDRLLFSKSWNLRKLGKYSEAAAALTELRQTTQDPFDKNRYSFWLARSLKQSGQEDSAKSMFEDLIQNDVLGYYGLLSYRETMQPIPPLNESKKSNFSPSIDSTTKLWVQGLTATQELDTLEKYLNYQTDQLKSQKRVDEDTWLYFLKSYAKAGLYLPLFQQLGSLPTNMKDMLLKDFPELLFPQKYVDLITPAAEKFNVRPELMLSIIRQESAFNTYARSPADAMGLMQVIPSVAKEQQSKTGIRISHYEDLYKPEINLPIGAALLSDLSKKYRGQFLLIAAAYNANEKAIQSWLKTRLNDDPLEFIEDIPYDETRAYIKLVLRNFVFYTRLGHPDQPQAFPEWCLQDLQSFKVSTR
jgi:soluble lytic murein transglycosylase